MLNIIRHSWSWIGLEPTEIVEQNAFGNVIVRAVDDHFWRICPEELSCKVIASDLAGYQRLRESEEFKLDWEMSALGAFAAERFGPVSAERCLLPQGAWGAWR